MHLTGGGVANVVYCNNNMLCKNNYYYALSTPLICNPTHLPSFHTGIADSGTSGINFAPNAPVANLNLQAPAMSVQVANGLPVRLIASATLDSAPSLPPATMQGHVMPSFPHTLVGLGPFANLNCAIIFTKREVFVVHPNGHCILKGWHKPNCPCLWQFPLQANKSSLLASALSARHEELGPCRSAANFLQLPPVTPNQVMGTLLHSSIPLPVPCTPPDTIFVDQLHPFHGFHATNNQGQACLIIYNYRAAQAMALAAPSSKTSFDP
jgi:hypothetical protein